MYYSDIISNYFDLFYVSLTENSNMILPALAMFSVAMLIIGKLYYTIRVKFPIKVNCWFCNSNTSVPYNSANSWYCSQCDQYNGFCSDGSYNRILTEQFNEKLNFGSWCSKSKLKSPSTNGLCRFCNINLELKVRQLAQFVPLNQANYDEEITLYSEQLERVYRLCSRCQAVLEKTLTKKQELFANNQQRPIRTLLNTSNSKVEHKKRHPLYLSVIAILSTCLLLTTIPHSWLDQLVEAYPSADQINQLFRSAQTAVPPYLLPLFGVLVQLSDCLYMRDASSFLNMLLWVTLLVLPYAPVKVDHLVSIVQTLASVVFLLTTVSEGRRNRFRTAAASKPVKFQKLDEKSEKAKSPKPFEPVPTNVPSSVSDSHVPPVPVPPVTDPTPSQNSPEDLGFSKLNVSSRRVTRSQSKPFQTKNYASSRPNEIFRPKPVNLSPPKLQLDKSFEYQVPLTRCSSQSSGFVSLSHQKDLDDDQAPSIINDNLESVSQYGGVMAPYRSPFPSPVPFPQYSPFSQFPPYTVMHFAPPPFDKVYSYGNMSYYEPSLNMSNSTIASQRTFETGWFQYVKNMMSSLLFLFLITSNTAILWKVFGEEYFKVRT